MAETSESTGCLGWPGGWQFSVLSVDAPGDLGGGAPVHGVALDLVPLVATLAVHPLVPPLVVGVPILEDLLCVLVMSLLDHVLCLLQDFDHDRLVV